MFKRITAMGLSIIMTLSTFVNVNLQSTFVYSPIIDAINPVETIVAAEGPALSADQQWIEGISDEYEYITEYAYNKYNADNANNAYWTKLGTSGGYRPDGTPYNLMGLVEGTKLQVASAWYGQDVYFRKKGTSGKGTTIEIPEYSQLNEQYKKAIRAINAYAADTGGSFYKSYVDGITDSDGYLNGFNKEVNISINIYNIEIFNQLTDYLLTDAEGNYIYDLVIIGAYAYDEPDISGYAAWVLRDYIDEGYGFLIGHDTLYGYGGVTDDNYVPDKNSKRTPYYVLNTKTDGHWNLNWLIGVNEEYTNASPYESDSLILSTGDYTNKSTMYGNSVNGLSELVVNQLVTGDPVTDVSARTPTNYPFRGFPSKITAALTHSNMQIAYGKNWLTFSDNGAFGKLVNDRNEHMRGSNNFYLTTNGNIGMSQIGHLPTNINVVTQYEGQLLANTIIYLSQREPCLICQSEQGGHDIVHSVTRISSVEELALIGSAENTFLYPANGCYVLVNDITLPNDWQPIVNFSGHFNANGQTVVNNGKSIFAKGLEGVVEKDGEPGYYVGGVLQKDLGLTFVNGFYYYIEADGTLATGDRYLDKPNGKLPYETYTFNSMGRLTGVEYDTETGEIYNGIVYVMNVPYYYEHGVKTYAGLISIKNNYYYADENGRIITDQEYRIKKTNYSIPEQTLTFAIDGKIIFDENDIAPVGNLSGVTQIENHYEEPTHPSADFDGWFTDKNATAGNEFDHENDVAGLDTDESAYASWVKENQVVVKYNANGGAFSGQPSNNMAYILPETDAETGMTTELALASGEYKEPTRARHQFVGWYKDVYCTDGKEFVLETDILTVQGSINIYAKWEKLPVAITYNANGGTFTGGGTKNVISSLDGSAVTGTYEQPTRTGYDFDGWYLDLNYTDRFDSDADLSGDTQVYAKWTANEYTYNIVYKSASDIQLGTASITNYFDTKNVTVSPKAFAGYTSPAAQTVNWDATSKTITFTYTPIEYTIGYTLNDGTVSSANPTTYTVETPTFTLNNPTKTGYTFKGWTGIGVTSANTNVSIAKGSTGDKTFTANWTASANTKYTVKHYQMNLDGVNYTLKDTDNLTGTTASEVTPAVKTYTGFTAPSTQTVTIAADGNTVVEYKYSRNKYYLNLNGNLDGTGSGNITNYGTADVYVNGAKVATGVSDYYVQHYYGSTYEINNITAKAGRKYEGVASGNLTETIGVGDVNVSLKFSTIAYTIGYTLNGGTVSKANPTSYNVDTATFTLNNPTKTGYTFSGWTGANGNTPQTSVSVTKGSTGNKTYTANWTANTNTKYTVKHYQMNLDGSTYTLKDTDNLTGTTDAEVTPAVKTYTGFTAPSTQAVTIAADGSTIVEYKYTRNKYYIDVNHYLDGVNLSNSKNSSVGTFDIYVNGTQVGNDLGDFYQEYYYGSPYEVKDIKALTGYTYSGETSYTGTVPANNVQAARLEWKSNTYSVVFNGNGSTSGSMSNQSFKYGTAQNLTANAFERAYTVTYNYNGNGASNTTATATATFNGWATSDSGAKVYNDKASVNNLTATSGGTYNLYANWTLGSVTLPTPTRTGYTFNGWYTAASGGTKVGTGGASYTPSSDVALYAQWTANTYSVVFNANGGSGTMANQSHTYGVEKALTANAFTYAGHSFAGWNTKADGTGTSYADKAAVKNLTSSNGGKFNLYAQWSSNSYQLSIDPNGGYRASDSSTAVVKVTKDYGATENISERKRTGYTLTGYTMKNTTTGSTTDLGGATFTFNSSTKTGTFTQGSVPITLTAQWTPNIYKVTLDNQSATTAGTTAYWYQYNTTTVVNGETIYYYANSTCSTPLYSYKITVPTKTGYAFGGYYTGTNGSGTQYVNASGSCINNLYKAVASDSTLYAYWIPNIYKVTLDNQGATTAGTAAYWYQYNTTKVINGETIYYYADSTCSTPLYSYKITVPTKTGYTFGGYYTGTNGSGTQYVNASGSCINNLYKAVASNSTLYAKWTANSYSVVFNANGGSGTISNQSFTYGTAQNLTANAFTRTGYTFKGWATTANGSVVYADKASVNNLTATSGGTVNLYAVWEANAYTVVFNANGGSGTMSNQSFTYGTAQNLTANAFTRTGYTFKGWATTANGSVVYADKASVNKLTATSNGTVNLYAVWEVNEYTYDIVYKSSTGTQLGTNSITKTFGTTNVSVSPKAFTGYTSPAAQTVNWDATSKTITFTYTPISYDLKYIDISENLIKYPYPQTTRTVNGVTLKDNGDRTITVNGTATGNIYQRISYKTNAQGLMTLSAGTYYLSGCPSGGSYSTYQLEFLVSYDDGETWVTGTTDKGSGGVATLTSDCVGYINLKVGSGATVSNLTFNPVLVKHSDYSSTTYTVESAITTPTPTRTGYTFAGWYTSSAYTGSAVTQIAKGTTGNKTLYAKWTKNEYTVIYNPNGGSLLDGSTSITSSNLVPYPFYQTTNTSNGITYTVSSDGTITTSGTSTATSFFNVWGSANSLTFPAGTYYMSGAPNVHTNVYFCNNNTAYIDRGSGYTFTLSASTAISFKLRIASGITLNNEVFKPSILKISNHTYGTSKALDANAFVRSGYTFQGWATSPNGSVVYKDKASVNNIAAQGKDIVTLYAVWKVSSKNLGWSASVSHGITAAENAAGGVTKTAQTGTANLTDYSTLTVTYRGLNQYHSSVSYYYSTFQLVSSSGTVVTSWSGNNSNSSNSTKTIDISGLSGSYYIKIICQGTGAGNYVDGCVVSAVASGGASASALSLRETEEDSNMEYWMSVVNLMFDGETTIALNNTVSEMPMDVIDAVTSMENPVKFYWNDKTFEITQDTINDFDYIPGEMVSIAELAETYAVEDETETAVESASETAEASETPSLFSRIASFFNLSRATTSIEDVSINGVPEASYVDNSVDVNYYSTDGMFTYGTKNVVSYVDGEVADAYRLYYFENGVRRFAGLIEIDGYYYYINEDSRAVVGEHYVEKNNGLFPSGTYTFDAYGRMINPPAKQEIPEINTDPSLGEIISGILGGYSSAWNLGNDPTVGLNQISYDGENTTSIARIVGTLPQLFGTDNTVDYNGYTIIVTDLNGDTYNCVVNREGKYVISNLPTLPQEKIYAEVFTPEGTQVTQYGDIYAIIATDAWNNCMTVPLKLENEYIEPLPDITIYEDEDITFTARYMGTGAPENFTWYFKSSHTGDNWSKAEYLEYESLDVIISDPVIDDSGEVTYVELTITVKDVPIGFDGYHFKVVIEDNGRELDTFDTRVDGKTGKVNVIERPWVIYPVADKKVWEGDSVEFTAQLTHYKDFDSGALTAKWQYKATEDGNWYDVEGSPFFNVDNITNTSVTDPLAEGEIHNVSKIRFTNISSIVDGFELRCEFSYGEKYRFYDTYSVSSEGYKGKISVSPVTIRCIESPVRVELLTNGANATGEYTYKAKFRYTSPDGKISAQWLFKPNQEGTWKKVSESPYYSYMKTTMGTPTKVDDSTYEVYVYLTLTNPPLAMDSNGIHYYFKVQATNRHVSATSGSADILFAYNIDIIPNEPVIRTAADGKSKIYTYPNLLVYAPNGISEFSVEYKDETGTDTMYTASTLSGVTAKAGNKGYLYSSESKKYTKDQLQNWLRTIEFTVTTDEIDVEWRISEIVTGANKDNAYGDTIYEVITVPSSEDSDVTFAEAQTRVDALTTAYGTEVKLATVESEDENIFISKLLQQSGVDIAWLGTTINHNKKTVLWENTATTYGNASITIDTSAYKKVMVVFQAYPSLETAAGIEEFYVMLDPSDRTIHKAIFDYNNGTHISRRFALTDTGVKFYNGLNGTTASSSVAVPYKVYGLTAANLTSNPTDNYEIMYNVYNANTISYMQKNGIEVSDSPSFPHGTTFSTKVIPLDDLYLVTNGTWNSAYSPGKWLMFSDRGGSYSWGSNYFQLVGPSAQVYTNSSGYGFSKKVPSSKYKSLKIDAYVPAIYHEAIGANIGLNSNGWDDGFNTGYSITFPAYTHTTKTINITNAPDYYFGMQAAGHGDANGNPIAATTFRLYNAWMTGGSETIKGSTVHAFIVEYQTYDAGYTHTDKTARASDTLYGPEITDIGEDGDGGSEIIPPGAIVDTEYRTDTDVIISTGVYGLSDINPSNPASVTFTIKNVDGSTTVKTYNDICVPAGRSQRAFVEYNTGAWEGTVVVDITTTGNIAVDVSQINATVSKIVENNPPDPLGTDTKPDDFNDTLPATENGATHTWSTFTCENDGTGWIYSETQHTASLRGVIETKPDTENPTAVGKTMKSGYGINTTVTGQIIGGSTDIVLPQTVITYFPEFNYTGYWRVMEHVDGNSYMSIFEYKGNEYSMEQRRVHFTPVWFPDGQYKLYATIRDAWTPVGELKGSYKETVPVTISGSIYDDWYAKETG